jgi:hypothetical protein
MIKVDYIEQGVVVCSLGKLKNKKSIKDYA